MPTTLKWAAPESLQSYLSTDLNSLGSTSFSALGAEIPNETDLYQYIMFELVLNSQGSARSAGAQVELWAAYAADGTTYEASAIADIVTGRVGFFPLDAMTNARTVVIPRIILPPFDVKFYVRNRTGQAFNATGNTLKYRRFNEQGV